jgi:uncharacterized protein (DUF58 family)
VTARLTSRGLGVLAVTVALLILALVTTTPELVPLVVAAGLPLLLSPVSASRRAHRARAGLAMTAAVSPPVTTVGAGITLTVEATNHAGGVVPALAIPPPGPRWRLWPGPTTPGAAPPVRLPRIVPGRLVTLSAPPARSTVVCTSAVPSTRRGVFVLPPLQSWVLDALGLCGVPGPLVPAVTVVLHPVPDPGATWPSPGGEPTGETSTPGPVHGREGPGDLMGIRPYVAGDRLSLLHWPARARHGTWFVRQFAPDTGAEGRLVIDDRAGVHRKGDFEQMLSTAQGLVDHCWRQGRTMEVRTLSGRSARLAPAPLALEETRVLLASLLPRDPAPPAAAGGTGTVLTTATGARSLPAGGQRIVVGR